MRYLEAQSSAAREAHGDEKSRRGGAPGSTFLQLVCMCVVGSAAVCFPSFDISQMAMRVVALVCLCVVGSAAVCFPSFDISQMAMIVVAVVCLWEVGSAAVCFPSFDITHVVMRVTAVVCLWEVGTATVCFPSFDISQMAVIVAALVCQCMVVAADVSRLSCVLDVVAGCVTVTYMYCLGAVWATASLVSGALAVTAADSCEHSTRSYPEVFWAAGCLVACDVTVALAKTAVEGGAVWVVICLVTGVLVVAAARSSGWAAVCFPFCGSSPAVCAAIGWAAVCLCVVWLTVLVGGTSRRRWQSAVSGGGRFSCSCWQSFLPAFSELVHHACFAETGVIHAAPRSREDRVRLDLRQMRRRKLFSLSGLRSSSPRRRRSLAITSYRVCPPAPLVPLMVSQTPALGLGGGR